MDQVVAVQRVDHIGIRVRDLNRALRFYRVLASIYCTVPKATTSRSFAMKTVLN
jgi:catechol 2,3-dioxygenase-like lactoylglutathione lyase family enzyme